MAGLDRSVGRTAFGLDPAGYDAARPDYPQFVWDRLRERCGLAPGCATFEIGAGTGTATRRLRRLGADPLVAGEPDPRLAGWLRERLPGVLVVEAAFEDWPAPQGGFDLGVAATAFHWLDEPSALARIARALRPGGSWAAIWNVFGDPDRADAFHDATLDLLGGQPRSPSAGAADRPPFALDRERRLAALAAAGLQDPQVELERWTLRLDAGRTRALYATYSEIVSRSPDEARQVLDQIETIAARQFPGGVERNMVTVFYTARTAR